MDLRGKWRGGALFVDAKRASRSLPSLLLPPRLRGRVGEGVWRARNLRHPTPALRADPPHKGEGCCGSRLRNQERCAMSLPAEKPTPAAADELPFWRRKAMKDM